MLNEKQVNELKESIGNIIQISKDIRCIIESYSENDEEIRLHLDNGYLVFYKEPVK